MIKIRFRKAQKGQGLVEYATIISLVSIVSIVILSVLGVAVARNYAVIAAVFGGKKNAASSTVTGLTNTIYFETTTPPVTCHLVTPGGATCSGLSGCGAKGMTFVSLTISASPDIQRQDLMMTANSVTSVRSDTGAITTLSVGVPASFEGADPSFCPDSVVVSGKKAIILAPVTATTVDN